MKKITISGKEHKINCTAWTFVKYKELFGVEILSDIDILNNYLINQAYITEKVEQKKNLTAQAKENAINGYMRKFVSDFISALTRITWSFIWTENEEIEDYENWLKHLNIKLSDKWISEVTEYAVTCFQ